MDLAGVNSTMFSKLTTFMLKIVKFLFFLFLNIESQKDKKKSAYFLGSLFLKVYDHSHTYTHKLIVQVK